MLVDCVTCVGCSSVAGSTSGASRCPRSPAGGEDGPLDAIRDYQTIDTIAGRIEDTLEDGFATSTDAQSQRAA